MRSNVGFKYLCCGTLELYFCIIAMSAFKKSSPLQCKCYDVQRLDQFDGFTLWD